MLIAAIASAWAQLTTGGQPPQKAQAAGQPPAARAPAEGAQSFPRFFSLKSDRVNVRRGPGQDHAIEWVYRRAGLPVEVTAASETWRRVRDAEGASGWVLGSLLSGRRTAIVEPWEVKDGVAKGQLALRAANSESAGEVAQIEAGVLVNVISCDGRWCFVNISSYRGYVQQHRLWGVYKGEIVK